MNDINLLIWTEKILIYLHLIAQEAIFRPKLGIYYTVLKHVIGIIID